MWRCVGTGWVWKQEHPLGHPIPTIPIDTREPACARERAGRILILVVSTGSSHKFNLQRGQGT